MRGQPAPVLGSALVGLAEAAAGIYLVVAIGPAPIALFFVATGICTLTIASLIGRLLKPAAGGGSGGGSFGFGDGDGGPTPTAPEWWPEFEEAFREYARERTATQR